MDCKTVYPLDPTAEGVLSLSPCVRPSVHFCIEKNTQVLEDIRYINISQNARNIKTFDFSILYTKIPLDDLTEKLKEIIDKAFKGGHNKYTQITSKTARRFCSKKNESFTKEYIFSMIDLVIHHSFFFKFGDKIFRQSIGIPMSIDPAPQLNG